MDAQPHIKAQTPDAAAVTERHLAMLEALAEASFEVAMMLKGRIAAPAPEPADDAAPRPDLPELALAFARATRAVRTTIALHAKLTADLRQSDKAGPPPPCEVKVVFVDPADPSKGRDALDRFNAARAAAPARKAEVAEVVGRLARSRLQPGEFSPRDTADIVARTVREAAERLDEDDIDALMRRPFSETLAQICRDLGYAPDWPALAQEAWAREEIESGQVGAPLARFAARPDTPPLTPPRPPTPLGSRLSSG